MMPSAVLLSVLIGVAGCGCPNSSQVIRSGSISRAFINMAPTSDSAADDITDLIIIFAMTDMDPLMICTLFLLLPR